MTDERILGIYRETIDVLYAYVSRRCGGDRELAQDITQETWLRAVRAWHGERLPDRPLAWLTTVAANLLRNEFRRRRPVSIDGITPTEILGAMENGAQLESLDVAALVNIAVAKLPKAQSMIIEAFHYEKKHVAQIADSLGISEKAAEGRLRRARENLRRELELAIQAAGGLE